MEKVSDNILEKIVTLCDYHIFTVWLDNHALTECTLKNPGFYIF